MAYETAESVSGGYIVPRPHGWVFFFARYHDIYEAVTATVARFQLQVQEYFHSSFCAADLPDQTKVRCMYVKSRLGYHIIRAATIARAHREETQCHHHRAQIKVQKRPIQQMSTHLIPGALGFCVEPFATREVVSIGTNQYTGIRYH